MLFKRHCLLQDLCLPLDIILFCKGLRKSDSRKKSKSGFKTHKKQMELRSGFESACASSRPTIPLPLEKGMPAVTSTVLRLFQRFPGHTYLKKNNKQTKNPPTKQKQVSALKKIANRVCLVSLTYGYRCNAGSSDRKSLKRRKILQ